ncbi:MAG: GNAT family N-acetyltransferase [Halanaerobiales bacterium]|nr:GNAT family N-acetyltransferase [Halanaerobiales bacterium]
MLGRLRYHIRHEKEIKNKIGFVYDQNYFYEDITVEDMKKIVSPIYSEWDDEFFYKYLKRFNLPNRKKIKELSKGMQMKFSLAMALSLSHNAELIIFKLLNKYQASKNEFWGSIKDFTDKGFGFCLLHENQVVCICY